MTTNSDLHFMQLAYAEALKAVGNSDPNPAVGAVVVSPAGEILATGYTQRAGYAHAERAALDAIPAAELSGCTLYVTLEPCCHTGRTPPCTDAILARRLGRVVISQRDHAEEVKGRSVALLQNAGIKTEVLPADLFSREKWFTTGPFLHSRETGLPRVILKWAQTAGGSLAPASGTSGGISGEHAAYLTAAMRSLFKFTLATPGTVRDDIPRLTVRFGDEAPAHFEAAGLSPFFLNLVKWQPNVMQELQGNAATVAARPPGRGLMVASHDAETVDKVQRIHAGFEGSSRILPVNTQNLKTDFAEGFISLLRRIHAEGYNSILVEAGPQFSELMLQAHLADAIAIYHSHANTGVSLWQETGRGNSVSRAVAESIAMPHIEGFELIERASWPQDEFLFFTRID